VLHNSLNPGPAFIINIWQRVCVSLIKESLVSDHSISFRFPITDEISIPKESIIITQGTR